jgi:hypothetical protein
VVETYAVFCEFGLNAASATSCLALVLCACIHMNCTAEGSNSEGPSKQYRVFTLRVGSCAYPYLNLWLVIYWKETTDFDKENQFF